MGVNHSIRDIDIHYFPFLGINDYLWESSTQYAHLKGRCHDIIIARSINRKPWLRHTETDIKNSNFTPVVLDL